MNSNWQLVFKDGSRHEVEASIRYEIVRGTKLIAGSSSLDGDPEVLHRAFDEAEVRLESPNGHQHRVAVDMAGGQWRVRGLGG